MTNDELILQKLTEMQSDITQLENRLSQRLDDNTALINLKIESEITKRIDSLFDGYLLTHEKQWALERKVKSLEERIEKLENKAC